MNLNENEKKVLEAMIINAYFKADGDFGFTDEIKVPRLTPHQVAGYIADLQNKKYIITYGSPSFQTSSREFSFLDGKGSTAYYNYVQQIKKELKELKVKL